MIATESGVIIVDVYDVKVMSSLGDDDTSDEILCSLMEYILLVEVSLAEDSTSVLLYEGVIAIESGVIVDVYDVKVMSSLDNDDMSDETVCSLVEYVEVSLAEDSTSVLLYEDVIAIESGVIVDVYDVKVMSSLDNDDMSDETVCSLMEYVKVSVVEDSTSVILYKNMVAIESGVIVDVYDVKVMSSLDDMSDETICSLMEVAVIEESIPVIISMLLDKRTIFNEKHSY